MFGTPLALLTSFAGLLFDRTKLAAILGLLLSGALIALFVLFGLC